MQSLEDAALPESVDAFQNQNPDMLEHPARPLDPRVVFSLHCLLRASGRLWCNTARKTTCFDKLWKCMRRESRQIFAAAENKVDVLEPGTSAGDSHTQRAAFSFLLLTLQQTIFSG